jgi:hypothetical protein
MAEKIAFILISGEIAEHLWLRCILRCHMKCPLQGDSEVSLWQKREADKCGECILCYDARTRQGFCGEARLLFWQTIESEASFIAQIMSGNVSARTAEDVDDMVITAAQVKAIATGNPQILEKVSVEVELSRLSRLYTVWRNGCRDLKLELQSLPRKAQEVALRVTCHEQSVAVRDQHRQDGGDAFAIALSSALRNDQYVAFDK